ncbi:hypothetical protein Pmani_007946 [Petrolisthes manimaculis]|uniref:Uncharacterized protein n=1 Tax=Petrolisthes manimaculis TaxID=1843537 RepID=A0AAE1Q7R3_9EUCA|nr:hypothetical protein Pmani_007941 [Petrolisthes manimaculis]KAK4321221.1 hypothetical protein Pmani_007946 [Petrolisthes manimaculis]
MCPDNVFVVTKGDQTLSNRSISLVGLSPYNHEEAESRIFTHALHAAKQQMTSVLIKTCDTDILIVAAWEVYPQVTPVFKKLSQYPPVVENADYNVLDMLVITMYDKNNTMDKVDEARLNLFARKQRPYDGIPPTSTALIQHVKWSVYQAGSIWGQAAVCKMQTESPANWGWQKGKSFGRPFHPLPRVVSS